MGLSTRYTDNLAHIAHLPHPACLPSIHPVRAECTPNATMIQTCPWPRPSNGKGAVAIAIP